jgi:signal transduction histidine kinase
MAEIDAREMALQINEVDAAEAVEAAADRARPRLAAQKVELVIEGDALKGDGGGARMRADPRRLGQILDHLLDNAGRATPAGGQVVLAADGSAGEVRIRVTDAGRGIPYHQQAHVFDRFVGRERGGPGLGLALVKALVELHGGWIELQSEPGAGATFTVHMPEAAAGGAAELKTASAG